MGLEKLLPGSLLATIRCRFQTMLLEDIADALIGDVVPQIDQRPLNAIVTPGRILLGQANHEFLYFFRHWRPPGLFCFAMLIIPLLGHQLVMPAENRIGRKKRADLFQQLPPQDLPLHGQPPPLIVAEQKPFLGPCGYC